MATDGHDTKAVSGASASGDQVEKPDIVADGDQEEGDVNGGSNKFQQAISTWRNLNLSHLVSNLDKAASQIVEDQKETVAQRKDLAAKTKDFRKLEDTGKLAEIKQLLKSYQNFIDLIANQSKAVNSAFLSAYTPLSDAPDPYPLLEASVESLVASEELVPRLEAEKTHLQKTITNLTSQLEDSEKQLVAERTTRRSADSDQDAKIREIQETWDAALKEKEENWTAREQSLEEKIENQDRLLKELKASYEVTQRLEQAGGDDIAAVTRKAANAELEILNSELEKATLRLADVEARNEQLRVQLAESSSKQGSAGKLSVEEEPAFLRLRSENTALLRKIDAAKYDQGSDQARMEGKIKALEQKIASVNDDRTLLRKRLDTFSDYDEVKQELEMIKAVEFATGDDDDDDSPTETNANGAVTKSSKSETLEQLLLSRNKKLNDELTSLRVSGKDIQQQLDTLQESLSTTNMELEKSRNLNAQLENELVEAQQTVSNFDTMSMAGTFTSRYPKSSYAASRRAGSIGGVGSTSPTSSIISGFDGGRTPSSALSPLSPPGSAAAGGPGILPMVTAQRDRFKKKLADLEAELGKSHGVVSSLRAEVATLQRDNLSLYEKTRYVASSSAARAAYTPALPSPGGVEVTGSNSTPSGLSLDRYRSAYEQSLLGSAGPLAAFRGRESARVLRRMTLPERGLYALARGLLATRASRNLFALYLLGLHVLVFYALFAVGSGGGGGAGQHVGSVAAGAAAAMAKDGGGGRGAVAAGGGPKKGA